MIIEKENQNVEFKEKWNDDFLKWICGFANASGGQIYIGVDDDGKVKGLSNSKKLLEDIPNKVRDILGIIVNIDLLNHEDKEYIKITVNPSSVPVNYKGEYHFRSGSTKQQLKGNALNQFLLDKTGLTWDALPIDNLFVDEFWREAFDIFKEQAILSKRMDEKDLNISNYQLLDNLGLIKDGKILRAGMLLFHQNPEKWINGSYIKIGYFESNTDIRYMDEVHGSLIYQANKVIDLIFTKYLKADISYEGVTRVETYPYPKSAIREAVYNAIVHKNYATQIPIQISIYKDKMYISNDCILPFGWSVETLMQKHRSKPLNPNIANGFFRSGFIEAWGRGIEKICEGCINYGIKLPEYTVYPEDIMVKFEGLNTDKINDKNTDNKNKNDYKKENNSSQSIKNKGLDEFENTDTNTDTNTDKFDKKISFEDILGYLSKIPYSSQREISEHFNVTKRTIERTINTLKKEGYIERVGNNRKGYWRILK